MPKLTTNGETMDLSNGWWSVAAEMISGSAILQMSINGAPFFDITGTSFTQPDGGRILVPDCTVKAALTGDAVWSIEKILTT